MANDRFFEFIITRLSCLYAEVQEENPVLDKRISRSISKVVALQASEGLHFGGVTMSTEKALTVGSVLGSLIVYTIHSTKIVRIIQHISEIEICDHIENKKESCDGL
jgi:hypothetical protein